MHVSVVVLNMTFDISLHVWGGRTDVRTDGHVSTTFSRIYRLPFFLTHGAPLRWLPSESCQSYYFWPTHFLFGLRNYE